MITPQSRLAAACRRLQFEVIKSIGIFWLIEKTPGIKIKDPWNKFYQRSKRKPSKTVNFNTHEPTEPTINANSR